MMDEERIRVLQMLKEDKITAEEALSLLEAMEASTEVSESDVPQTPARWLKIRVTDLGANKPKVMVNLPMKLVNWALKTGSKFSSVSGVDLDEMGVDLNDLSEALSYGFRGKLIDVIDEDEGQHVEIVIE
ncbi:MAG TPA: hypothetical protein PLB36_01990 [Bacillota bacterium]|nr:hypothetical protein [Candidatus Fermentithermobacillaceae bacterium]HOB30260.1 hypothetical protein [Bacillota bacterium]HOK64131.1 hypothetical protein [Bacillota bacterium]HOL11640.1 hypothetical protein [Bacillota bacterium]HOQ02768.1 hypothetical protein [Bacillota bacterium]